MDQIFFGDLAVAQILLYDDAVMDRLRGRTDVDFVPIERVFAQTLRELREAPLARAEELYALLRDFYLRGAGQRGAAWDRELTRLLEEKRRSG